MIYYRDYEYTLKNIKSLIPCLNPYPGITGMFFGYFTLQRNSTFSFLDLIRIFPD
jgi:hypothetical protein